MPAQQPRVVHSEYDWRLSAEPWQHPQIEIPAMQIVAVDNVGPRTREGGQMPPTGKTEVLDPAPLV